MLYISSTSTNNLKNADNPQLSIITNNVTSSVDFKVGTATSSTTNEFIVNGVTTIDDIIDLRGTIKHNQPYSTITASQSSFPTLSSQIFCNIVNDSAKNASNSYINATGVYLPSRTTVEDGTIIKVLFRLPAFPVGYYIAVYGFGWGDGSGPITERIQFLNYNKNYVKLQNGNFVEFISHSTSNHGWIVTRHNGITVP